MEVRAQFSKWRASPLCCGWCRVQGCLRELFLKADTAPTEAAISLYIMAYSFWLWMHGYEAWDYIEYHQISRWMPTNLWPVLLCGVGLAQFASLLSMYPLTLMSRAYRLIVSVVTSSVLSYMAFIWVLERPTDPHFLFYAGLATGGWWVVLRTRDIR